MGTFVLIWERSRSGSRDDQENLGKIIGVALDIRATGCILKVGLSGGGFFMDIKRLTAELKGAARPLVSDLWSLRPNSAVFVLRGVRLWEAFTSLKGIGRGS